jgi:hypothetical protein
MKAINYVLKSAKVLIFCRRGLRDNRPGQRMKSAIAQINKEGNKNGCTAD